ncbi:MAG: hypothetical protein NZ811_07140 [Gammaproteobacteria bacterium]|nr:hypothetical protein [Gammaproteobacteria bacterium]
MEDIGLYGLTILVTMLGYFLHSIADDLKEIQREHNNCKEHLPHKYVLKDDYHLDQQAFKENIKDDIADIKSLIGKLFDKVEGKRK